MKNLLVKLMGWLKAHRTTSLVALAVGLALLAAAMVSANRACQPAAQGRVFASLAAVPEREVGLVLGTSKTTPRGKPNLHFDSRIAAAAITRDFAGFRTLDSVVRAKAVFGLDQCMIVTEAYHCPRALWIAEKHGLDAVAYAAPDVALKGWSLRAQAREALARTWCAVDLYVLHREPKFDGPKEPALLARR